MNGAGRGKSCRLNIANSRYVTMLHSTSPLCPSITGLREYNINFAGPKVVLDAISGGIFGAPSLATYKFPHLLRLNAFKLLQTSTPYGIV